MDAYCDWLEVIKVALSPWPSQEVALRTEAAKSPVLGFARVDEQLAMGRAPARALAKVALKARGACDQAAGQAAQQGERRLPPPPGCLARDPEPVPGRPPPRGGGRRAEWSSCA